MTRRRRTRRTTRRRAMATGARRCAGRAFPWGRASSSTRARHQVCATAAHPFSAVISSNRGYGVKPLEAAARATRSRARFPPALGQQPRRAALCADAAAGREGGPGVHRCAGVDAQQCTVDFLGGNHTRNLPVVAFVSREQRGAQGRAPTASSTTGSPNARRGMYPCGFRWARQWASEGALDHGIGPLLTSSVFEVDL